ncbi:AP2 domain-containing protein [Staphylococcus chromogenes]|uniref:AP2 domain-containing protein n=1 Tax=Staphylococcus chromogenes TaxID=46126 RepID=UPI003B00B3F6
MVKSIYLQDGEEIFVDDQDYERVNQHLWHKQYVGNTRSIENNSSERSSLSSFILDNSYQKVKNNYFTRDNLTTEGNKQRWSRPRINSSSRYKGVSWYKYHNKWRAGIRVQGKRKHLGFFSSEWEAAQAYNNAVDYYWDGQGFKNVEDQPKRQAPKKHSKRKQRRIKIEKDETKFRGVYDNNQKAKPYTARVSFNGKSPKAGTFKTKDQAALAYNNVALFLHGEDNVILNDVTMTEELKAFIADWEIPDKIKSLKSEE